MKSPRYIIKDCYYNKEKDREYINHTKNLIEIV